MSAIGWSNTTDRQSGGRARLAARRAHAGARGAARPAHRPGPPPRRPRRAARRGQDPPRPASACASPRQLGMDTAEVTATRSAAQIPFGAVAPLLLRDRAPARARCRRPGRPAAPVGGRPGGTPGRPAAYCCSSTTPTCSTTPRPRSSTRWPRRARPPCSPRSVRATRLPTRWWRCGRTGSPPASRSAASTPEPTAELLGAVLGGPVDPATAVQFTERCQGNALFLRELVTGALDDGTLRDDGGPLARSSGPLSPSAGWSRSSRPASDGWRRRTRPDGAGGLRRAARARPS